jgi:NTE family protein
MFSKAVFQGGGVKGIALIGALSVIDAEGIRFNSVAGTSAGSIVAALYAAGYSVEEMKTIFENMNFLDLLDKHFGGAAFLLFRHSLGLYKGRKIYEWIYRLLEKKRITTFSDIPAATDLKIAAADITTHSLLIFDRDRYAHFSVAAAVRMSISIPFFFDAVKFGDSLVVDGGVISNFPLQLFPNNEETLGFQLISNRGVPRSPHGPFEYIGSLMGTMLEANDKLRAKQTPRDRLIEIDTTNIPATNFALSEQEKQALFQQGRTAALEFYREFQDRFTNRKQMRVARHSKDPIVVTVPVKEKEFEAESDTLIRVSISALLRIEVDGKYLLVRSNRIQDQFQPVGGVLKMFPSVASDLMNRYGVLKDKSLPLDSDSIDDLRVRVPYKHLSAFIGWYCSERGRELSPWREFYEELIATNVVDNKLFPYIQYEYKKTAINGLHFSEHFQCWEVLIGEIYDLILTPEQVRAFRGLQDQSKNDDWTTSARIPQFVWCNADLIRRRGNDPIKLQTVFRVADTAEWILQDARNE